jgi:hypothetical protein
MTTREVCDDQHGTRTGYVYGCRCQPCRTANEIANRARRRKGLEPDDPRHGTLTGYAGCACRCEDCSNANLEYLRQKGWLPAAPEAGTVTLGEVREWARGLGLPVTSSLSGRNGAAIIARWNREHPERQFTRTP